VRREATASGPSADAWELRESLHRGGGGVLDAPPPRSLGVSVIAGAGALVVHAALVVLAIVVGTHVVQNRGPAMTVTELFEVEMEPPPAPAPAPSQPAPKVPARPRVAAPVAAAPPPAAAQAAPVLAAAEDVVDFGDTFVAGKGASYAGGFTEANGTATQAVRDQRAQAGGVEAGTGTLPAGDLSRLPQLADGVEWDCPFPPEADDAGVDHAVVTLRVEVSAAGNVTDVRSTSDPGHGFAREARACATTKRWSPGLNRAGAPSAGAVVVNVRFDR
jgi:protein TonB